MKKILIDEATVKLVLEAMQRIQVANMDCDFLNIRQSDQLDKAITTLQEALANEALDKMAENARELGLDYEPAQTATHTCGVCGVPMQMEQPAPVQGWKLVPVEPTTEMLQAADDADDEYTRRNFGPRVQRIMQGPHEHYNAMLAAAPQPAQQEPVAKVNDDGFIVETGLLISPGQLLYTTPQPAQQEPVAAECKFEGLDTWGRCSVEHHNLVQSEPHKWPKYQTRLLYTSPPAQRTWVGLSANEVEEIFQKKLGYYPTIYAAEAKLREKNQ